MIRKTRGSDLWEKATVFRFPTSQWSVEISDEGNVDVETKVAKNQRKALSAVFQKESQQTKNVRC